MHDSRDAQPKILFNQNRADADETPSYFKGVQERSDTFIKTTPPNASGSKD
jgi:hypothetical protein